MRPIRYHGHRTIRANANEDVCFVTKLFGHLLHLS
jgi:hypothetical protein